MAMAMSDFFMCFSLIAAAPGTYLPGFKPAHADRSLHPDKRCVRGIVPERHRVGAMARVQLDCVLGQRRNSPRYQELAGRPARLDRDEGGEGGGFAVTALARVQLE